MSNTANMHLCICTYVRLHLEILITNRAFSHPRVCKCKIWKFSEPADLHSHKPLIDHLSITHRGKNRNYLLKIAKYFSKISIFIAAVLHSVYEINFTSSCKVFVFFFSSTAIINSAELSRSIANNSQSYFGLLHRAQSSHT